MTICCDKEVTVAPKTEQVPIASIIISSNPSGAIIYEDGKNSSMSTPDTLSWLEEKEYKFTLKLKNYRDTSFAVNVKKNQIFDIKVDFTSNPDMRGVINCSTNSDSALIYLDGIYTGWKTPNSLTGLLPGDYKIGYTLDNHRSDSIMVTVKSKSTVYANINLIDTTLWVDYIEKNSELLSNYLMHIAIDKNDNKWISSSSLGLIKFDSKGTWTNINLSNSELPSDICRRIYFDGNNTGWISNYKGISSIKNDFIKYYERGNRYPIPSINVNDVVVDFEQRLWAATDSGIAVSDFPDYRKWKTYLNNIVSLDGRPDPSASIFRAITIDEKGILWAANYNCDIFVYKDNSWQILPNSPDRPYSLVTDIEANNGFLYISMETKKIKNLPPIYGGVMRYTYFVGRETGGIWKDDYKDLDGIEIYSLMTEENGDHWIATKNGLHFYTLHGNYMHYTINNTSFYTNQIADLANDSNGDLWVVSKNAGLYHFKRGKIL